jgi:hypothetical protein
MGKETEKEKTTVKEIRFMKNALDIVRIFF